MTRAHCKLLTITGACTYMDLLITFLSIPTIKKLLVEFDLFAITTEVYLDVRILVVNMRCGEANGMVAGVKTIQCHDQTTYSVLPSSR